MTSKDKTVKIKAKYDCAYSGYKSGDVFEATYDGQCYSFVDHICRDRYRDEEEFTIVPEDPTIEVGSEWVNHKGNALTVEYVGKYCSVCTWNDTGKEFASPIKGHLKFYKPKPKAVTMYFYRDGADMLCASEYEPRIYNTLFTREIELP